MRKYNLSHFSAKKKSSGGNSEPSYLAKSASFAGLQLALSIFKEIADNIPVPGLQDGLQALMVVMDAVQVH